MSHPLNNASLRFAVVGPGALGTLFAARLACAGVKTLLLDYRLERARQLSEQAVCIYEAGERREICVEVTADPRRLAEVDVALILVKAYHTEAVAATLSEHLQPEAVALTLQNGLGNIETLSAYLGSARVLGGTTAQGALLEAPGVVHDTGSGPTIIGRPGGEEDTLLDKISRVLLHAGFAVSITRDLPAALWGKAILNAAINPAAALTRLRNGALAEHEPSLKLMTAAAREASAIARAHGISIPEQDWRARLLTICQATAPNVNSMLADILHQRRTEIDAINGAIVRIAEQHDLPASVNRTLWCLISTMEATYADQVEG
jgi:2-dehydropantoate 2-reductase